LLGLNKFEQIGGNEKALDLGEVLDIIDFKTSTNIFYIHTETEISSEETIDRLKLVEAIDKKYQTVPNIRIALESTGVAITVKTANGGICFS
jgi:hypothetical protein